MKTKFPMTPTEPYEDKTCFQCNGTGKIFLRPNSKKVPFVDCDMCKGTGKHELITLWFVQGGIIKEWRIKNEMTLRECARKYSIDPSNLSKMERGIIRPDTSLVQLSSNSMI